MQAEVATIEESFKRGLFCANCLVLISKQSRPLDPNFDRLHHLYQPKRRLRLPKQELSIKRNSEALFTCYNALRSPTKRARSRTQSQPTPPTSLTSIFFSFPNNKATMSTPESSRAGRGAFEAVSIVGLMPRFTHLILHSQQFDTIRQVEEQFRFLDEAVCGFH
jgi:hypothetical protein